MEHGRKTKIPEDPQHQQQPRGLKGRPGAGAARGDEVSGRQKARKAAAAGRTPREGRRDGARGPCTEGRGGRPTPTELAFRDTGLRGAADQAFLGPDPEGSRTTPNGTGTSTAHAVLSAEDGPGRPQRRGRGWPSARRTLPASRVGSGGMKSPSGRVGAPTAGQPPQDRVSGFPAGNGSFAVVLQTLEQPPAGPQTARPPRANSRRHTPARSRARREQQGRRARGAQGGRAGQSHPGGSGRARGSLAPRRLLGGRAGSPTKTPQREFHGPCLAAAGTHTGPTHGRRRSRRRAWSWTRHAWKPRSGCASHL